MRWLTVVAGLAVGLSQAALVGCSSADLVVAGVEDTPGSGDTGVVDDGGVGTVSADGAQTDTTPVGDDGTDGTPEGDAPDADAADDGVSLDGGGSDASVGDATVGDAIVDDAACDALVRCYFDRDGDGFVTNVGPVDACRCPSGARTLPATGTLFDCDDEDPAVHPGAGFHDGAYCVPGGGCATKSFDYDCNGSEDEELPSSFGGCSSFGSGCSGAGWQGSSVPSCGATQNFVTCSKATLSCSQTVSSRVQRCR